MSPRKTTRKALPPQSETMVDRIVAFNVGWDELAELCPPPSQADLSIDPRGTSPAIGTASDGPPRENGKQGLTPCIGTGGGYAAPTRAVIALPGRVPRVPLRAYPAKSVGGRNLARYETAAVTVQNKAGVLGPDSTNQRFHAAQLLRLSFSARRRMRA
jgi:hypothetical protein